MDSMKTASQLSEDPCDPAPFADQEKANEWTLS